MLRTPYTTLASVTLALAGLLAAAPLAAQAPGWLFPDRALLPDLLAGPRDPVVKGELLNATDNPAAYGPGVAGEAAIAGTVPVLRLAGTGPRDALVVGMQGAAFARFSFQVVERELMNTDWVFAVPIVWHRGEHWLRLRYYHTSSHLGDEYQRRFGPSSINFSRDAVDLTAYLRPAAAVGVYGSAFWSANSHPEDARPWTLRAGLELDPSHREPWHPFAAADLELEQDNDWAPTLAAQAGAWLPPINGRPFRLAVTVLTGHSPMGQFHRDPETHVGFGLFWNP